MIMQHKLCCYILKQSVSQVPREACARRHASQIQSVPSNSGLTGQGAPLTFLFSDMALKSTCVHTLLPSFKSCACRHVHAEYELQPTHERMGPFPSPLVALHAQ